MDKAGKFQQRNKIKKKNVTKMRKHICAKFTFTKYFSCGIFYLHKIVLVLKDLKMQYLQNYYQKVEPGEAFGQNGQD